MDKLISAYKLIRDLRGIKDMLVAAGDPFLASVMNRAIKCVEDQEEVEAVSISELNKLCEKLGYRAKRCGGMFSFEQGSPWTEGYRH